MQFALTPFAVPVGYGDSLVPMAEIKAHLQVEHDDENLLIGLLRDAAVDMAEQYCSIALLKPAAASEEDEAPTRSAAFDCFGPIMRLGIGPVATLEVVAIAYVDSAGEAAAIDEGGWRLGVDGRILPAIGASWPTSYGPVTVTYRVGYAADECPPALKAAVKMFTAHLFENRGAVVSGTIATAIPLGFEQMCNPYRMVVI